MKGIPISKAKKILKSLPKKFLPVGSISYKKPIVGDIDVITMETPAKTLKAFENKFKIKKVNASGKKKLFFNILVGKQVIKINIWFATKSDFPFLYFSKIYPTKFNIKIRNLFKKSGFTLSDYSLKKGNKKITSFVHRGRKIKLENPKDFFMLANKYGNIPYRSPQQEYKKELKGGDINNALAEALSEGDGLLTDDPNSQIQFKELDDAISKEV